MMLLALSLLLQAGTAPLPTVGRAQPPLAPELQVQLGARLNPDTVTVGQRFLVLLRVRVPRGSTVEFPSGVDSTRESPTTAAQVVGTPALDSVANGESVTHSAAYRMAAWDVGPQPLGLGAIVVRLGGRTGYVSIADRSVFVQSVLPADTTLRVPKPPRPQIVLAPFNWLPWLLLLAALVLAALLWWLWRWYRKRFDTPLDPFAAAERDFDRVEAMGLIAAGEGGRHVALMSDVMRYYLAARVPGIRRSHTSSELLAAAGPVHGVARGLGELLWRADLVKFAGMPAGSEEAMHLGGTARDVVHSVESYMIERDAAAAARKKAA